jgi:hypothetical protein
MRPARLNEVCEYRPIYDPSGHRALVRPFLDEVASPCIVGIMLEYVHDDAAIEQMNSDLEQRLTSIRDPRWLRSVQIAIGARVVRLGFRIYEGVYALPGTFGRPTMLRLVEDEWGNLYASHSSLGEDSIPITERDLAGGFSEVLCTPAATKIQRTQPFMRVAGAYIDEWGTLWIDGTAG